MAIKDIIGAGIGFAPGSTKWIPTRGFASGVDISAIAAVTSVTTAHHNSTPAYFELWLTTDTGERIQELSTTLGFSASKVLNNFGWLTYNPPASFDPALIRPDRLIQVWYTPRGGLLSILWNVYFLRKWRFNSRGVESFGGPDLMELLRRRVLVAYSGNTTYDALGNNVEADLIMQAVVEAAVQASTDIPEDSGTRAWPNFSVYSTGVGYAPQVSISFPLGADLLTSSGAGLLPSLAKSSKEQGTETFYVVVPDVVGRDSITFQFRTAINFPGRNLIDVVTFDETSGSLLEPDLEFDYSEEKNYLYGGGQGEQSSRVVRQVYDVARYNQSIWGRIEGFQDARNQSAAAAVQGAAEVALWEGRPKVRYSARAMDTEGTRFARDWDVGDLVSSNFQDIQFNSLIRAVSLTVDQDGRLDVDARLDYEN